MSKLDNGAFRPSDRTGQSDASLPFDWSSTPLGPVETWSPALGTAAALALAAHHAMVLFWGPDFLCVMNAAAQALCAAGPVAVAPAREVWPDGWARLQHDVRSVFDGAASISHHDRSLPARSRGRSTDRRFSLACSPILDPTASSGVGGVIVSFVEHLSEAPATDPRLREFASAAQAAIATSEERLRLGLEAGRMVTWEFDLHTGELTQSSNSEAIFGPGSNSVDYIVRMPPEDAASDRERLHRALLSPDGVYASEFRYNHPDGRLMFLQNWGQVVRDAAGTPTRVHGVCMDITDRKQAENALVELNETLEQQVERRTEELLLAEEALRQAQKMEALGHLTGGVAHDFNNLLGAMIGSFEMIRRKHDDGERVREWASAGLLAAERGAKLISQLLTFSRVQRIELVPVSVDAVVDGMREMLRRTLGPLVNLKFDVVCTDRFVRSDPTQLEMAVLNLAINARDAMRDGGQLTIAVRQHTIERDRALAAGEYVELLLQDTGTGMSPEVAARAFDPFFTTKGIGKGTGLGLSQVHGLAQQAGGAVRIESRLGDGTTIRVLLPCTAAPETVDRPAQPPPDHAKRPDAMVLLVDDDHDLRSVLAAALRDFGYGVIEAGDGAEGLMLLEQHGPDLLIADFAMPEMTGAELARAARLLKPSLAIIFASGYAETAELDQVISPAPRVLRKPFRLGELQTAIEQALDA